MDNLKTLMDKHEFDLVIKLTENAKDSNSLFYRASAFLSISKGEEALNVIRTNRNIMKADLALLIKMHIEILCILGKFDEAHEELDYYMNLPYESQEVEELLRNMPKYIRLEEKKMFKMPISDDETLIQNLLSNDNDLAIGALDEIRHRDVTKFIDAIAHLMEHFEKQSVRSFALMLLIQKGVNKSFKFNHLGEIITVNPIKLDPPFTDNEFMDLIKLMQKTYNNPVLFDNAVQLYSSYIIYTYPEKPPYTQEQILIAMQFIASTYLRMDISELKIDEETRLIIKKITSALEDF